MAAEASRERFVSWQRCAADGCLGAPIDSVGHCVVHSTDEEAVDRVWMSLYNGRPVDFVRGLDVGPELLREILRNVPNEGGKRVLQSCDFTAAVLPPVALFNDVVFRGVSSFRGARFAYAEFHDATFEGVAYCHGASFDEVLFKDVAFGDRCEFLECLFSGSAAFENVSFSETSFDQARFGGFARFSECAARHSTFYGTAFDRTVSFHRVSFGEVHFVGCKFIEDAVFDECEFASEASFRDASFGHSLGCYRSRFDGGLDLRRCTLPDTIEFPQTVISGRSFELAGAVCRGYVDVECKTASVGCRGSRFLGGGHLRLGPCRINLTRAEFPVPFIISSAPEAEQLPRLASVTEANVAGLLLIGVDVSTCTFANAHNLDQLRLGGRNDFAWIPPRPARRSRRVLMDEVMWRVLARQGRGPSRNRLAMQRWQRLWGVLQDRRGDLATLNGGGPNQTLDPPALAELYRSLRKGREDNKDEPGAADFYYSEMEMRRLSQDSPLAERALLWGYKTLSGYGLRASRSLMFLLLAVLASAIFFSSVPTFSCGAARCARPFLDAVVFGLETTIGAFRSPAGDLTVAGRVVQVCLRVVGPLLLGLSLVAIRGRVKR